MPTQPLSAHTLAGSPKLGQYYRHSGQLNPAGVVAAAVIGGGAAAVLAVPYAYADRYIPEIHLNGLVCGLFGLALGAVPAFILKRFKVRNLPVSLAVIAVVAVVGLYVSWGAWESIYLPPGMTALPRLLARPDVVVDRAVRINAVGTWGIGSTSSSSAATHENTTGVFLALIWLAEAATLVGAALLVGRGMLGSQPFCDACDRWCDGPVAVRTTAAPADPSAVRPKLEAGDFAYPATLGPATPDGGLTFSRHTCGGCGRLNTLTVASRSVVRDKKGRARRSANKVLVNKLLVSPDDLTRVAAPAATAA